MNKAGFPPMLEKLALAIVAADRVRAFGLYDYSAYPGSAPPHVVRDETNGGKVVFRSEAPVPAQREHERLSRQYVARAALQAIRQATDDMALLGAGAGQCWASQASKTFTAMIDAILSEGAGE